MKKVFIAAALSLSLAGCAGFGQKLDTAWQIVTSAAVSPQQIIIAGNAFDAAEASATNYMLYCQSNLSQPGCALSIRQKVVAGVRAGRAARNQLEPYVTAGTAGPSAIYNTLVAAVTSLQSSLPATGAPK